MKARTLKAMHAAIDQKTPYVEKRPQLSTLYVRNGAIYASDGVVLVRYRDRMINKGAEYHISPDYIKSTRVSDDVICYEDRVRGGKVQPVDAPVFDGKYPDFDKYFEKVKWDPNCKSMRIDPGALARVLKVFDAVGARPLIGTPAPNSSIVMHADSSDWEIDACVAAVMFGKGDDVWYEPPAYAKPAEKAAPAPAPEKAEKDAKVAACVKSLPDDRRDAHRQLKDAVNAAAKASGDGIAVVTFDAANGFKPAGAPEKAAACPGNANPAKATDTGAFVTVKRPHASYDDAAKAVEAMGFETKLTSACLWITSQVKKTHADALKDLGFVWSGKRCQWYLKNPA